MPDADSVTSDAAAPADDTSVAAPVAPSGEPEAAREMDFFGAPAQPASEPQPALSSMPDVQTMPLPIDAAVPAAAAVGDELPAPASGEPEALREMDFFGAPAPVAPATEAPTRVDGAPAVNAAVLDPNNLL